MAIQRFANSRSMDMASLRARDRLVERLYHLGICNHKVIDAIRSTPRHLFLDEALAHLAYENSALPIGQGQTLSQPFVVAKMTEALLAGAAVRKVLEIGTGSGYQTAILASLVDQVCTVERIRSFHEKARKRFRDLKIRNVLCRHADGYKGWPQGGKFDAIIVTAAAPDLPEGLLQQLSRGGRLIIPVTHSAQTTHLYQVTCSGSGYRQQALEPVRFVPLLPGVVS